MLAITTKCRQARRCGPCCMRKYARRLTSDSLQPMAAEPEPAFILPRRVVTLSRAGRECFAPSPATFHGRDLKPGSGKTLVPHSPVREGASKWQEALQHRRLLPVQEAS